MVDLHLRTQDTFPQTDMEPLARDRDSLKGFRVHVYPDPWGNLQSRTAHDTVTATNPKP